MRERALGFEGLIKTVDMAGVIDMVLEPATLDDIVVYHTEGGEPR